MTAEDPRPFRLKRLDRVFARSAIYFVTACTANRREILASIAVHEVFVAFCLAAAERGAWVGRYVLMPDHVHLFVALDDERIGLPVWMKRLKNAISSALRRNGVPPPHWQKGFFDHVLRSSESYSEKWHYVCENPVRAALAATADDWPFGGEICDLGYHETQ